MHHAPSRDLRMPGGPRGRKQWPICRRHKARLSLLGKIHCRFQPFYDKYDQGRAALRILTYTEMQNPYLLMRLVKVDWRHFSALERHVMSVSQLRTHFVRWVDSGLNLREKVYGTMSYIAFIP